MIERLVIMLLSVLMLGIVTYYVRDTLPVKRMALLLIGGVVLIWLLVELAGQAPVWRWSGPPPVGRVR
jgi:hypothetical protein